MLFVNVAAVVGSALVLRNQWNDLILQWCEVQLGLSTIRLMIWGTFLLLHRQGRPISRPWVWQGAYVIGLLMSGGFWGALSVGLIVSGEMITAEASQYTVLIILSALAGGASGVTSTLKFAGIGYICLLLLPTSGALMFAEHGNAVLAALALIFCAVMVITLSLNHSILVRSLALEDNNLALINELSALNNDLEAKVAERTERLSTLAGTDSLTGLLNRHGLMDWWTAEVARNSALQALVFFLDLDRFKNVNDALGHDVGDCVLTATAHRIRSVLPQNAALARWGGDEFVLVYPCETPEVGEVVRVAGKISDEVNKPLELNGETIRLGVSIGWSRFPDDDRSFSDVVHAADLAVTEIKRTRRGMVLAYSETFAETLRRRFDLGRALGDAIGTSEISLVYQPIVDSLTGEVIALEALARWKHPELGSIRPDEFIRLAEDTDRIVALGEWVLRRACRDAAKWHRKGCRARAAVNISIKQLVADGFQTKLVQILNDARLPPFWLDLEVTESVFDDEHIDRISQVLSDLKALGVRIYIDDFGTGYSSLSRLSRLTVDGIKIDKSFVADLDGPGRVIIDSAVIIAKTFGLRIIAEGVETVAQATALEAAGVDALQGYLIGHPLPVVKTGNVDPVWRAAA